MATLVRLTTEMFPDAFEDVLRPWHPTVSPASWQRALLGATPRENNQTYALTDGPRIVGLSGMILSRRVVRGQTVHFCNLHTWVVRPEYRGRSLLLLKPALDLKDHTLTDLTPTHEVLRVMPRLGFAELDRAAIVLPALPWQPSATGATIEEMTESPEQYAAQLDPADAQIYADHHDTECGHMLLRCAKGYCYVVYARIKQRLRTHCFVYYISHLGLFAEHHASIRAYLMSNTDTRFVLVDGRMLTGIKVPFSFRVPAGRKLFRSTQVEARDVDSLYSELIFMKQSTLGGLRPWFYTAATRYVSAALRNRFGASHRADAP